MSTDDDPQLPLLINTPAGRARVYRISRRNVRKRLPVVQPQLPVADSTFQPVEGVPRTRQDCPTERPCVHVRCKYSLLLETGHHRAGRPGLASVPRDARGLTTAVSGQAGAERAGTTLRPAWLHVRGLELEREVKAYVTPEHDLIEVRSGTMDYWLARLHVGEPVLVFCDDTGEQLTKGHMRSRGEFLFESRLPERVVSSPAGVVLTRVRGVSSCALDEIERVGEHSNEQVGDAVGRHRTLVAREVRKALAKAIANAEAMGMSADGLMQGIAELRRMNGRG